MYILCPINFSDASLEALNVAIQMASENKQGVIALYSFRLIQPNAGESIVSFKRNMEKTARDKFDQLEGLFNNGSVDHKFLVEVGFFSDNIVSQVKANEVSMVVMDSEMYKSIGEQGHTLEDRLKPHGVPVQVVAESGIIRE